MPEDVDGDGGVVEFDEAASVLGEGEACAVDLARAGLAPELDDRFVDLAESGRPDGVASRDQSPTGVHRDASSERRDAFGDELRSVAGRGKSQVLGRKLTDPVTRFELQLAIALLDFLWAVGLST